MILGCMCYAYRLETTEQNLDVTSDQVIPSLSLEANITKSILDGLDFFQQPNSTECFQSLLQFADDYHFINSSSSRLSTQNTTRLQTALNVSMLVSTSLANTSLRCPSASLYYLDTTISHFSQFRNNSLADILESFLVGLVSTSYEIRSAMVLITENSTNQPKIWGQFTRIIKNILLFNSVYSTDDYDSEDVAATEVKLNIASEMNQKLQLVTHAWYRFTEFLGPYSLASQCSASMQIAETNLILASANLR